MVKRKTNNDFIKELKEINENIEPLEPYINARTKIKCMCKKCGNIWYPTPDNLINKKVGCKKCNPPNKKRKTHKEFIEQMKMINNNIIFTSEYVKDNIKIECKCKICEHEWMATPSNILRGKGCPKCGIEQRAIIRRQTHEEFIELLRKKNPLFEKNFILNSIYKKEESPIECLCLIDGETWITTPACLKQGCGCPRCNLSKLELETKKILEKLNIKFIPQKKFKDCIHKKYLRFDFYLPYYNICIECDGRQHYEAVDIFGGEEEFKIIQKRDQIKNNYCKENKIGLIRIPYWDIKKIEEIISELINNQKTN